MKVPLLRTERLILRPSVPSMVDRLLAFDTENQDWLAPWEPLRDDTYLTPDRVVQAIAADRLMARRGQGCRWHLTLVNDPMHLLGSVALTGIARGAFQSAFLGYRIGQGWIRQGLGLEAVLAVVQFGLGPLGLHRIEANIMPRNTASLRLAQRAGFVEEGLAQRYLKIAGKWEDHLHYVIRQEDACENSPGVD